MAMPSMKPRSPIRFTMKALRALSAYWAFLYQKPMRRKLARPTPSQPMNITG